MKSLSKISLTLFQFLFILIGGLYEVSFKVLTKIEIETDKGLKLGFDHLYFLICVYFISEFICIIPYLIRKRPLTDLSITTLVPDDSNRSDSHSSTGTEEFINEIKNMSIKLPKARSISVFRFILPALFDALSKVVIGIGIKHKMVNFNSVPNIFITVLAAIYSRFVLKKSLNCHSIAGFVLFLASLFSFIIVDGINNVFDSINVLYILICLCVGEVLQLAQFYLQEKNLKNKRVNYLQEVGMEGMWGSVFFVLLLVGFQFINCNPTADDIVLNSLCGKHGKVEDSLKAFEKLAKQPVIYFFIAYAVFGVFYSIFSVLLIERTQTVIRVITDNCNVIISISVYIILSNAWMKYFQGQTWSYYYIPGIICAVVGVLIFVEVIKLPGTKRIEDVQHDYNDKINAKDDFIR